MMTAARWWYITCTYDRLFPVCMFARYHLATGSQLHVCLLNVKLAAFTEIPSTNDEP